MRGAGREDSNLMKHRQENAAEDGSRDPGGSILAQLPCPAPVPWRKRGWGVGGAQLLTHLLPALAEPMEAGRCWREEAGGGDSVRGDSAALRRAQGWR